jgi:hypothetical protein
VIPSGCRVSGVLTDVPEFVITGIFVVGMIPDSAGVASPFSEICGKIKNAPKITATLIIIRIITRIAFFPEIKLSTYPGF